MWQSWIQQRVRYGKRFKMLKMSKVLFLFLLLVTTLLAKKGEQFSFVGLSVWGQNQDIHEENIKHTSFAFHYGKQSLDLRTTFSYEYSSNSHAFEVKIDKFLVDKLFGTNKIRPYIGIALGTLNLTHSSLEDNSGFYFGGSGGIVIYASDVVDIDLAYRYNTIKSISGADKIHGLGLAVHYFF